MEITRIASERNDEGDYRLDCCVGYVKLFLLDRWRCRAVDGTLRRKGLHWLLGPLCLYKQSSKGRKIFLNSLGVVSEHCVITFFTIYSTFMWINCCVYALFAFFVRGLLHEDTLYHKTFVTRRHLSFGLSREILLSTTSLLSYFSLQIFYMYLNTTFSHSTCNIRNKPFSPGTLPPLMVSEWV